MIGALSQVVPDKVAGDLCRTSFHNLIGGYDAASRREWVHYEWSGGGNGGFAEADGPSAMAPFDWGDLVTVQSSEVIETRFPLLVEESRLAADTGGAGDLARRARHAAAHAADGGGGALLAAVGRGDGAGVRRAGRDERTSGRELGGRQGRRRDPRLRHAGQGRRASCCTRAIA